ncbi:hypothetical protein J1605_018194 [Eschrichtius robustus]|uniref:Uncharacterized protein n=1 Tax=Eschrichtius robustus TaxID=9764 RepID=A0AB34HT86_ESCRO|nr:hypothetical protein J1605_018194 [Eschrichtius robustus]
MQGHEFKPWSGKIPPAAEQLGPCATTTEPALYSPFIDPRCPRRTVEHAASGKGELICHFLQKDFLDNPTFKIPPPKASLVAQWLRIRLPMQGTQVRSLVWEDPTCRGATKPVRHNY